MKPKWNPAARPAPATSVVETREHLRSAEYHLPMSDVDAIELNTTNRLALHNMLTGQATQEALAIVVTALNMAMILAEMGFGAEQIPSLQQALAGAFRATQRGARLGRWGFDGPAIAFIKDGIDTLEQQLVHATRDELVHAINVIHERFDDGNVYSLESAEK